MHKAEPRHHSVAILLYQLQHTGVLHKLMVTQLATNHLNARYLYHKSSYPELLESNSDLHLYLSKISFNSCILLRLCLGLPRGVFHFSTLSTSFSFLSYVLHVPPISYSP